jgi:hypothetical protein
MCYDGRMRRDWTVRLAIRWAALTVAVWGLRWILQAGRWLTEADRGIKGEH